MDKLELYRRIREGVEAYGAHTALQNNDGKPWLALFLKEETAKEFADWLEGNGVSTKRNGPTVHIIL
jgi:hypothetical protein